MIWFNCDMCFMNIFLIICALLNWMYVLLIFM